MVTILCAYILDLCFGDPRWFPHPIRGMGWLIKNFEKILRKIFSNQYLGGIVLFMLMISITYILSRYIIDIVKYFNEVVGLILSIIILWTTFSIKDLKIEAMEVYKTLEKNDLILARKKLSMIVGRDTNHLNKEEIIRATIETIAESTVDGIISPIFYAFLGGAPLALTYKAVNTLDSMVGYNNKRYREFGWFSAKVDNIVNFIPSIIAGILMPIASFFIGKNIINSFRIVFCDGIKNMISGIPESAIAGALQIQLGGLNFYNSIPVTKPLLGKNTNFLEEKHIKESIKIAYISSLLTLVLGSIILWNIAKY